MILKVANYSMLTGEGFIEIKKEIVFKKREHIYFLEDKIVISIKGKGCLNYDFRNQ